MKHLQSTNHLACRKKIDEINLDTRYASVQTSLHAQTNPIKYWWQLAIEVILSEILGGQLPITQKGHSNTR